MEKRQTVFSKNDIIPQKHSFYNPKRKVISARLRDENNEHTERVATLEIAEEAYVDILNMRKIKDQAMINLILDFIPEGVPRDMLLIALTTGNKKNIIFDTTEHVKPFSEVYAEMKSVSTSVVNKAMKRLLNNNWIVKLNKYQYMLNPYYITHGSISTNRVAQLQYYWDKIEAGENIHTPIEWIKDEKNGDSFETKRDISGLLDAVKKSDAEYNELKRLKKQHLEEDNVTLVDADTLAAYRELYIKFVVKNHYEDKLKMDERVPTEIIQHFAKYIKKGQKAGWSEFDNLPHLNLDRTYKPLRLLE